MNKIDAQASTQVNAVHQILAYFAFIQHKLTIIGLATTSSNFIELALAEYYAVVIAAE